jgi:hypothetical protein
MPKLAVVSLQSAPPHMGAHLSKATCDDRRTTQHPLDTSHARTHARTIGRAQDDSGTDVLDRAHKLDTAPDGATSKRRTATELLLGALSPRHDDARTEKRSRKEVIAGLTGLVRCCMSLPCVQRVISRVMSLAVPFICGVGSADGLACNECSPLPLAVLFVLAVLTALTTRVGVMSIHALNRLALRPPCMHACTQHYQQHFTHD